MTQPVAPARRERDQPPTVTDRMAERLAERKRAEAARRRRRWRSIWAMVAVVAVVFYLVFASPAFALDADSAEIDVYARVPGDGGDSVVRAADVRAVLEQFDDARLTTLRLGAVEEALADVDGVREVDVRRAWPRGLVVSVGERVAVAAVPDGAGGYVVVDSDALEIRREQKAPATLPVVTVPVGAESAATLDAVLAVIEQMPIELAVLVEGVRADSRDSVALDLRDGKQVVWGNDEDTALKAEVLLILLRSGAGAGANRIDVSAPELPIVATDEQPEDGDAETVDAPGGA